MIGDGISTLCLYERCIGKHIIPIFLVEYEFKHLCKSIFLFLKISQILVDPKKMTLNTPLPFFVGCFCADAVKDNVRQHGGLLVGWKPPTKEAGGCWGKSGEIAVTKMAVQGFFSNANDKFEKENFLSNSGI